MLQKHMPELILFLHRPVFFRFCLKLLNFQNLISSPIWQYFYPKRFPLCMTSITIGSSMATIGESAFQGCNNVTNIYCYAESVPETASNAFVGLANDRVTLRVPAVSVGQYQNTTPWRTFRVSGPKCATPTIIFENGRLTFECETEGAEFEATIQPKGDQSMTGNPLFLADVPVTYSVRVFAYKDGYMRSDAATRDITYQMRRGDVNRDGVVNEADLKKLIDALLNKE